MQQITTMGRFYVYTLTDPRNGAVFYVGKGQRARIDAHEAEAKTGKPNAKCARIRQIWGAGLTVQKAKVSTHEIEADAYRAEAALILQLGANTLTNVAPGGLGPETRPFRWTLSGVKSAARAVVRTAILNRQGYQVSFGGMDINAFVRRSVREMIRHLGKKQVRQALTDGFS